jgi:hypothetical protein
MSKICCVVDSNNWFYQFNELDNLYNLQNHMPCSYMSSDEVWSLIFNIYSHKYQNPLHIIQILSVIPDGTGLQHHATNK